MTLVALIPARSGSRRIINKNIRQLSGHPMIAYTIAAARSSGVFSQVIVSTDSPAIAEIAEHYGATTPFLRPPELSTETSPDIEWVLHALADLELNGPAPSAFALLRPTSPFRSPQTIVRAWHEFEQDHEADSLRAVELCRQHPAKMWEINGDRMRPVMTGALSDATPWHSAPYQVLPKVFAQNASLEIARVRSVLRERTISGQHIRPFYTQGFEGFDINEERDWVYAEHLLASGEARLPAIAVTPTPLLQR